MPLWPWSCGSLFSSTCSCPISAYTVKALQGVVTCVKRSPFSCPIIEKFIWIEPLLRGHLYWKITFSLSQRWPPNACLTVYHHWDLCVQSAPPTPPFNGFIQQNLAPHHDIADIYQLYHGVVVNFVGWKTCYPFIN